jgi:hypothetical protein
MMTSALPEFDFVADLPKREAKKVQSVIDQWNEFKTLVRSKGTMIPPMIAARIANVSKQRIYQLVDSGTLEHVRIQGHGFITEISFTAWLTSPRTTGRPSSDAEPNGRIVDAIRMVIK